MTGAASATSRVTRRNVGPVREPCTGIAASWCPNCGDCICRRFGGDDARFGEIVWEFIPGYVNAGVLGVGWSETAYMAFHYNPSCPLHGPEVPHAEVELAALRA